MDFEVIEYVTKYFELGPLEVDQRFDLVNDVQWSGYHEDEKLDQFLEEFLKDFGIEVPEHDYSVFAEKHNLWRGFAPIAYIYFIFFARPQFSIEVLSVRSLILIAQKGELRISDLEQTRIDQIIGQPLYKDEFRHFKSANLSFQLCAL